MNSSTEIIRQSLTIGHENRDMDLFVTYGIEGEEKTRMKCDSFLAPMINHIYNRLTGLENTYTAAKAWEFVDAYGNLSYSYDRLEVPKSYFSYDLVAAAPSLLIPANYTSYWKDGARPYEITNITESGSYYYIYFADGDITTSSSNRGFDFYLSRTNVEQDLYIESLDPYVGADTNPVQIDEPFSADEFTSFDEGATNYAVLTTDQQSTVMTVSKSFTNNTGTDITVTEIGLKDFPHVIAKDVLQTAKIVPNGKTLTLDYEVRVDLNNFTQDTEIDGVNGGFVEQFLASLRDIIMGLDDDMARRTMLFCMFGRGDAADMYARKRNDEFGIRLGQNNKYVSMTDTDLNPDATAGKEPIAHGNGDGQLNHGGMGAEPLIIDTVNNEASFVLYREFENKGSVPVPVNEIGLFANTYVQNGSYDVQQIFIGTDKPVSSLIARTALDTANAITFNPGERKRIEYEVKMTV